MLEERLTALEQIFDKFGIASGPGVSVVGSLHTGLAVNVEEEGGGGVPSGGGGGLRGCTNPMATNYNPYATVDDGSCVFPSGDCPTDITLACDSVSASLCKCGFSAFIGVGYYLVRTATMNDSFSITNTVCGHCNGSGSSSAVEVATVNDLDCTYTISRSGLTSSTTTSDTCDPDDCSSGVVPGIHIIGMLDTEFADNSVHNPSHCTSYCGASAPFAIPSITSATTQSGSASNLSGSASIDIELLSEYTTALLISNTEDALPDYDGSFASANCIASANLATDESCYAITRFEYKFTFSAVGNDFILSWNEHTVFDAGGTSDNPRSVFVAAGSVETSLVFECLEPTANGTTTITDIVCTPH